MNFDCFVDFSEEPAPSWRAWVAPCALSPKNESTGVFLLVVAK